MFDSFVYNDKEQNSKKNKYMKLVTKYVKLVLKPNLSTFVQGHASCKPKFKAQSDITICGWGGHFGYFIGQVWIRFGLVNLVLEFFQLK